MLLKNSRLHQVAMFTFAIGMTILLSFGNLSSVFAEDISFTYSSWAWEYVTIQDSYGNESSGRIRGEFQGDLAGRVTGVIEMWCFSCASWPSQIVSVTPSESPWSVRDLSIGSDGQIDHLDLLGKISVGDQEIEIGLIYKDS